MQEPTVSRPFVHIKPKKGISLPDFKELFRYRDLFSFLIIRDIKVKYKQTVLGGLWAIIQPFFMMVVFSIFFGKLAKIPSDGVPYPIFNFSAMIAWTYFSQAVNQSANSIVGSQGLITKVYFPRLIIPISPVLAGLLDFFLSFIVLALMMLYFRIYPSGAILLVPLLIIIMMLAATGVGLILTALNAKYRDIKYTIPFLMQFWMFATPIVYPVSLVPEKYRMIYALNPMTGIVEGFRSALLNTTAFPYDLVFISFVFSLTLFVGGVMYFHQVEHYFADVI